MKKLAIAIVAVAIPFAHAAWPKILTSSEYAGTDPATFLLLQPTSA